MRVVGLPLRIEGELREREAAGRVQAPILHVGAKVEIERAGREAALGLLDEVGLQREQVGAAQRAVELEVARARVEPAREGDACPLRLGPASTRRELERHAAG